MIENRTAYYNYEILEQVECGLVLTAQEVKAIAANACSLNGAYCRFLYPQDPKAHGFYLVGATIGTNVDDQFSRKLLLHKKEIVHLYSKSVERGLTLVPLKVYLANGKFKLLVGVAKGKKEFDKRATEKKRDIENETRRIVKSQKLSNSVR